MAKKVKVLYREPKSGSTFLRTVTVNNTKHVRNKKTGQFQGRKKVSPSAKSADNIKRNRVKEPFVLVKRSKTAKGHIRQSRKEYGSGEFF